MTNTTNPCDDCGTDITLDDAHPTCACSPALHGDHKDIPGVAHKMIYVCDECAKKRGIPVDSPRYLMP